MQERKRSITTQRTSSGRQRQIAARAIDTDALEDVNVRLSGARIFLKESIQIWDDASAVKDKYANELSIWQDKFTHRNRNALIHHDKDVMQPLTLYY